MDAERDFNLQSTKQRLSKKHGWSLLTSEKQKILLDFARKYEKQLTEAHHHEDTKQALFNIIEVKLCRSIDTLTRSNEPTRKQPDFDFDAVLDSYTTSSSIPRNINVEKKANVLELHSDSEQEGDDGDVFHDALDDSFQSTNQEQMSSRTKENHSRRSIKSNDVIPTNQKRRIVLSDDDDDEPVIDGCSEKTRSMDACSRRQSSPTRVHYLSSDEEPRRERISVGGQFMELSSDSSSDEEQDVNDGEEKEFNPSISEMTSLGGKAGVRGKSSMSDLQQKYQAQIVTKSRSDKSNPTTKAQQTQKGKAFARIRESLAQSMFQEFNRVIFGSKLPSDMRLVWVPRLTRTAGRTVIQRQGKKRDVFIELSTKILDREDRLRSTLCHELCHAAVVLLDHDDQEVHGPKFYRWGKLASSHYPEVEVSRCHTYDIQYKYYYQCTNSKCGYTYGRHSKSIDTATCGCGYCQSRLILLPAGSVVSTGFQKSNTNDKSTPSQQENSLNIAVGSKESGFRKAGMTSSDKKSRSTSRNRTNTDLSNGTPSHRLHGQRTGFWDHMEDFTF